MRETISQFSAVPRWKLYKDKITKSKRKENENASEIENP